ncbi:MAG: hypothetical protein ACI4IN_00575 [Eubacterium sp.]
MDVKQKKRYIRTVLALFLVSFFVTLGILLLLHFGNRIGYNLSPIQLVAIALGCGAVPAGSYTGFVALFSKLLSMSNVSGAMLVVFCIPLVLAANIYGMIILIPNFVKTLAEVIKNKS